MFSLYNGLVTLLKENCRNGIFITQVVPEIVCLLFAGDAVGCAESAAAMQRITKTCLFKYTENFTKKKILIKILIFFIFLLKT